MMAPDEVLHVIELPYDDVVATGILKFHGIEKSIVAAFCPVNDSLEARAHDVLPPVTIHVDLLNGHA